MQKLVWGVLGLAAAGWVSGQTPPLLQNGGFEETAPATLGADGRVAGWTLGAPPEVPRHWHLNSAYPGELACGTGTAHAGERFARLGGTARTTAHLYQPCAGLKPGTWYRVGAWVRGGPLEISFYDYFQDGHIGGGPAAQSTTAGTAWQQVTGFYATPAVGYLHSALALSCRQERRLTSMRSPSSRWPCPSFPPTCRT